MNYMLRSMTALAVTLSLCAQSVSFARDFKYYERYPQRNAVVASNGMVTATSPLATNVGVDILKRGG